MSSNPFKLVEIADIHFGNGRVPPALTYSNLSKYLYPQLNDCQLLVINGDTFDTMLNLNSDAGYYVAKFIDDVISLAIQHQFLIRVVRGTFSHDRHQNRFFLIRGNDQLQLNGQAVVRVFDKLTIEQLQPSGLTFLYCPDNLPYADLNEAVLELLSVNHLKSVDAVFSHGYFRHLLPENLPHVPADTLDWVKLKSHVKGYVFNGHVHHCGLHERVICSGSFERFDHSVVEKVGFWIAKVNGRQWHPEFIENPDSLAFKTFYTSLAKSDTELADSIREYIEANYAKGYSKQVPMYIRIVGDDHGLVKYFKDNYPTIVVTNQVEHRLQITDFDATVRFEALPTITEANLVDLIYPAINDPQLFTKAELKELLDAL